MRLELYYILKRKADEGKRYRDNWNGFTTDWSSGYRKAMCEIDEILNFYNKYVELIYAIDNSLYYHENDQHNKE